MDSHDHEIRISMKELESDLKALRRDFEQFNTSFASTIVILKEIEKNGRGRSPSPGLHYNNSAQDSQRNEAKSLAQPLDSESTAAEVKRKIEQVKDLDTHYIEESHNQKESGNPEDDDDGSSPSIVLYSVPTTTDFENITGSIVKFSTLVKGDYSNCRGIGESVSIINAELEEEQSTEKIVLSLYATWINEGYSQTQVGHGSLTASAHPKNIPENMMGRRDYFVHISFVDFGVHRWFQLTFDPKDLHLSRNNSACDVVSRLDDSVVMNFTEDQILNADERKRIFQFGKLKSANLCVKMVEKYYDTTNGGTISRSSLSTPRERMTKLFNLRGQLNYEITFKVGKGLTDSIFINESILRDYSPVLSLIFDSSKKPDEKPQELLVPYVSYKAMKKFHDWIYGINTGVWLESVSTNIELLKFSQSYMILELIQICTQNLINITDEKYTVDLAIEAGKLGERYEIPGLEDRVFNWIKNTAGAPFIDRCMPWVGNSDQESAGVTN